MFKCEGCPENLNKKRKPTIGNTGNGIKEFRVTTIQRKVSYINQVRFDKQIMKEGKPVIISSFKNVGEKIGLETVEEKAYCKNHIPKNLKVKVLDKIVERVNLVAVKKAFRGEN